MHHGSLILRAAAAAAILADGQIKLDGIRNALTWRPRDGARAALIALRDGVALVPHATGAELPGGIGQAGLAGRLLHGGQASLSVALGAGQWARLAAERPSRAVEPGPSPWIMAPDALLSFRPGGVRLAAARSGVACVVPTGPWLTGLFEPLDPGAPLALALAMAGLAGPDEALPSGWTAHEMAVHADGAEGVRAVDTAFPELAVERPALALPALLPGTAMPAMRSSCRRHDPGALPLAGLGAVLRGALGDCGPLPGFDDARRRPYPTAGARQGLGWYLVAGRVEGLAPGLHRWQQRSASLVFLGEGGGAMLEDAAVAWGDRDHVPQSLIVGVLDIRRLASRYPGQGYRFGLLEAGAALQALSLAAAGAGLAGCVIGGASAARFAAASGLDPWKASPVAWFALGGAEAAGNAEVGRKSQAQ